MYDSRVYIKGEIEQTQHNLFVGDHILEVNGKAIKSKHLHQQYKGFVMLTVIFDEYSISLFIYYLLIPHKNYQFRSLLTFNTKLIKKSTEFAEYLLDEIRAKKERENFFQTHQSTSNQTSLMSPKVNVEDSTVEKYLKLKQVKDVPSISQKVERKIEDQGTIKKLKVEDNYTADYYDAETIQRRRNDVTTTDSNSSTPRAGLVLSSITE